MWCSSKMLCLCLCLCSELRPRSELRAFCPRVPKLCALLTVEVVVGVVLVVVVVGVVDVVLVLCNVPAPMPSLMLVCSKAGRAVPR